LLNALASNFKIFWFALDADELAGFNASGEGYNGEYGIDCPEENAIWKKDRDNALREALAEQPAQKRPQNCGTGYCSCIECVMEPEQPIIKSYPEKDNSAQRTWVGLTNQERENVIDNSLTPACVVLATEAKLKEKNQ